MPDQLEPESLTREIGDLETRIAELRQAAGMREADPRATLDAALVELDLALTALHTLNTDRGAAAGRASAAAENERRVLRTVFQDAPVPLFLLDRGAGVRRVNRQAAALLGTSPGYVSGKRFTAFCDLPTRAALRSRLAAVVRTGRRCRARVRFLGGAGPVDAVVTLVRVWIRGEPDPMVVAAAAPADGAAAEQEHEPERPARRRVPGAAAPSIPRPAMPQSAAVPGDDGAVATIVHRMDVLASASELLLQEPVFNETVAVRRCARLLAAELADWVIVDLVPDTPGQPGAAAAEAARAAEGPELRRQVVLGPPDEASAEAARLIEELAPAADTLPGTVHAGRNSALHPHVEELDLLGTCEDGQPVCVKIGAGSVLCVPVEDGERCLGAITLAVSGEHGPFDLLDLSVAQRLGRYVALVIRAARLYRRRAQVADSLQASLLPRRLPSVPGLALVGRYIGATDGVEVGGDFYDVFPTPDGWGLVLGDVCGKGEDAAAVTATARHGVRLLSRRKAGPAEVLSEVNEVLLDEDRFVTAVLATLVQGSERVTASLGSAGHPPAIVVRADGVIRTASGGGVPLGLFDDFDAGCDTVALGPGDTLYLYSDGVLEACDIRRRQFGIDRLMDVLAANAAAPLEDMLGAVESELLDFCDGDLRDDVSMLAVRVLPPGLN
ncbi:SpoIIE family protein phosphatase [Actinomadura keratinilytica]|uniref:PAS domain-containing protein n=1 Tax=Actinomadura keratinilytica TaxID=547461 RepID=A0ABP7ZC18_9ACTN